LYASAILQLLFQEASTKVTSLPISGDIYNLTPNLYSCLKSAPYDRLIRTFHRRKFTFSHTVTQSHLPTSNTDSFKFYVSCV